MHATPRVLKEIKSDDGKYKAVILERTDGQLQIEIFHWLDEPLDSEESWFGWSILRDQSLAGTVEQAEQIALERLKAWCADHP
jgi:hypothetical protein